MTLRQQSRQWRVVPLALLAIVATTAAAGGAMELFWDLSGQRYAEEVLRERISGIDLDRAFGRS